MKNIVFLNDWGEGSKDVLARYSKQTPSNSGIWGSIRGVDRMEEADYYVVFDGFEEYLSTRIDWSRVLYFQREPTFIKPLFSGKEIPENVFYVGTYDNSYCLPTWWIEKSFDELSSLPYPNKTKKISSITSGKRGYHTYEKRINFLSDFTSRYPEIDIYGRGSSFFGESWRGELNYNGKCKFKGLVPYEYTVVLENTYQPNTWSEKPADAILSWSFPIYSGDTEYYKYFPKESYYNLELDNFSFRDIIDFIKEPPSLEQIQALSEARNLLLYKWNPWAEIERIISERK